MSPSENKKDSETAHDSGREGDRERDREKDKSGKAKGSSKTKDLSHVPCKFFKVGSCTAGSSCPFSHTVLEPGQQKEVCAWFVKGNCKFGHKCALAHILPGQNMSMDRKNKKAAQLAASASNAGGGGRDSSRSGGRSQKGGPHGGGSGNAQPRILSGSTAPIRTMSNASRSGIPMPLKATLSPSTPAPPVKDTDFASFGLPDESNKLPSAPAHGKAASASSDTPPNVEETAIANESKGEEALDANATEPSPLPVNTSTARRVSNVHGSPGAIDFGPIGSPPRSSPSGLARTARINGFSPGTSPHAAALSSSPFSAPGNQSIFVMDDKDGSSNYKSRSGLSASLGAMMNWPMEGRSQHLSGPNGVATEVVVEDEDLEEFIPGSLSELLTPEERSRRFSRTNGARPDVVGAERDAGVAQRPGGEAHHRYSRSVPAPSLLQDIRSIWADNGGTPSGLADVGVGTPALGGGLGNGTPSSFQSNSGLAGRPNEDFLSPSNASAAFLPGLHHHYMNAKTQRTSVRPGVSVLQSTTTHGASTSHGAYMNAYSSSINPALSSPRTSALGNRALLETGSSELLYPNATHRNAFAPPGFENAQQDGDTRHTAFSPSARALQSHAPGQSLPQGLAAGYSRIHALPPPVIASPSTPGAFSHVGGFSPGTKTFGHTPGPSGDWHSMSPSAGASLDQFALSQSPSGQVVSGANASLGGLDAMFSHLSYSAAASRATASGRTVSGRNNPQSPLSRPVLTNDDDLFSMDG